MLGIRANRSARPEHWTGRPRSAWGVKSEREAPSIGPHIEDPYASVPLSSFTRRLIQAANSERSLGNSGSDIDFEPSRSASPVRGRLESPTPHKHSFSRSPSGKHNQLWMDIIIRSPLVVREHNSIKQTLKCGRISNQTFGLKISIF